MKNISGYFTLVFIAAMFAPSLCAENLMDQTELETEAKNIVKTFGGLLKPKLKHAIQSGGLEHAINVCAIEAPKIANDLSNETGWSVKRVSLKPRNANTALPDTFERKVLEQFNKRQEEGEQASAISYSEIVDNKFRFMKAQGVEGLCLNCHGQSIQPDVKKALTKYYPTDTATGYSLGQIRGAFSLIKDK
jgi:hypothetical protein